MVEDGITTVATRPPCLRAQSYDLVWTPLVQVLTPMKHPQPNLYPGQEVEEGGEAQEEEGHKSPQSILRLQSSPGLQQGAPVSRTWMCFVEACLQTVDG